MTTEPYVEIDEVRLEQRIVEAVVPLSRQQLVEAPDVEVLTNWAANTFLVRFRAMVTTENVEKKSYKIIEEPVFESARHAYLHSLPYRSFRRRFLGYWWGIDPDNIPAKRRIHEVEVDAFINYPDYKVPNHLGRYFRQNNLETESYWVSQ